MATPHMLVGTELVRITVPLGPSDGQPIRQIFGTSEVSEWIKYVLPKLPMEKYAASSPEEEFDELLFNFISSKGKLVYGKTFKDLIPALDEVWELKTYQLRIFGWFYRKDQFIACEANRATLVKRASRGYSDALKKVLARRTRLPLDEPKFVGGKIDNVLSGI